MKKMMIALAVLPLAACQDGVTFDHTSTMEAQTRGVAMFNWNDQGVAGMLDQTCSFDIADGVVLGDLTDLPGTDDSVVDGDGAQALVTSGGSLWSVNDWGETWSIDTPSTVLDAGFNQDGTVALVGDVSSCGVYFADWSMAEVGLSDIDCGAASLEGHPNSQHVYVADGSRVLRVDQNSVMEVEQGADLMAFDARADALIIASSQGSNVRGITADGDTLWTVEVDGTVNSLDTLGNERFTVVSFTTELGGSEIVVLNSNSGDVHADAEVPVPVDVTASPDGVTVALDTGDEVHFYDVTPGNALLDTPGVQPNTSPAFGD